MSIIKFRKIPELFPNRKDLRNINDDDDDDGDDDDDDCVLKNVVIVKKFSFACALNKSVLAVNGTINASFIYLLAHVPNLLKIS